jgi:hypothetical protein
MANNCLLEDSVSTSVSLKIFTTKEDAIAAHTSKSKLVNLPMSIFTNVDNFNPERLQKKATNAYPLDNRPRGDKDISSVEYHREQMQHILPIWLVYQNERYLLLDGAHRIVAHYIEGKSNISAYVIDL